MRPKLFNLNISQFNYHSKCFQLLSNYFNFLFQLHSNILVYLHLLHFRNICNLFLFSASHCIPAIAEGRGNLVLRNSVPHYCYQSEEIKISINNNTSLRLGIAPINVAFTVTRLYNCATTTSNRNLYCSK